MKKWYNNKRGEHNIHNMHQHTSALNIGIVKSATLDNTTLKNAISNTKRLNQCNIKQCNTEKVQRLIVKYYNGTILNSATITIAITTSTTATSAI